MRLVIYGDIPDVTINTFLPLLRVEHDLPWLGAGHGPPIGCISVEPAADTSLCTFFSRTYDTVTETAE